MAWTAFPTWVVGQVSLASDWNTYVANNMNFLATPPIARVYRNAAYSAVGNAVTVCPYDSVTIDSASAFSVSTHLYTIPVAGSYSLYAQMYWSAITAFTVMIINHNGAQYSQIQAPSTAATYNGGATIADLVGPCVVGDTLSASYEVSSTYAANVGTSSGCYMAIQKVSN